MRVQQPGAVPGLLLRGLPALLRQVPALQRVRRPPGALRHVRLRARGADFERGDQRMKKNWGPSGDRRIAVMGQKMGTNLPKRCDVRL